MVMLWKRCGTVYKLNRDMLQLIVRQNQPRNYKEKQKYWINGKRLAVRRLTLAKKDE